jgi:hypothetical protein
MRRLVVETLALALVLTGASIGLGQSQPGQPPGGPPGGGPPGGKPQPGMPPAKSKLEEMLAEALKNNPDIRVAVAKLAEADAELNRTRLLVTQKVIDLHHALLSQKAVVEYEQKRFERMKGLAAQKSISSEILDEAQQKLTIAKAKLAELEAQMPAVLGKVANTRVTLRLVDLGRVRLHFDNDKDGKRDLLVVQSQTRAEGPMADKIRQALEKPITLKVSEVFIPEILSQLQKQTGVTFKRFENSHPEPKLNLEFAELSLRAALQYIEDSEPGYHFVVREYGILFAPAEKLPPGALTVQEFLRQKPAGK